MTAKERMEQVGIETRANKEAMESRLIEYTSAGAQVAIVRIPVSMLKVDETYQVTMRTDRPVYYLTNNFDRNKLMPITVVPHFDEGLYYIVDGFARVIATQIIDKKFGTSEFKYITAMVLLNAPENPEERRKFEADLYAYQDRDVAKLKPIQRHGAKLILKDKATAILEKLKGEYGFEYTTVPGNRSGGILGSYVAALKLCENGEDCARYVFDICKRIRFDSMMNGYASYVLRAFMDAWKIYPEIRKETEELLCKKMRGITPTHLKAFSVAKYPMLEYRAAVSFYVEDMIVEYLNENHVREIVGTRLRAIA